MFLQEWKCNKKYDNLEDNNHQQVYVENLSYNNYKTQSTRQNRTGAQKYQHSVLQFPYIPLNKVTED